MQKGTTLLEKMIVLAVFIFLALIVAHLLTH